MSFIAGYLLGCEEGAEPVIAPLEVTENGSYTAPEGTDGYSPVNVNVPIVTLNELTVMSNGTYTAPEGTGYTPVYVNVPDNTDKLAELEQQIEELKKKVGYTFPKGTTMSDIKKFTNQESCSTIIVSSAGNVCAKVEFGYNEREIYDYSVTYGAWSKSEQRWLTSFGFRQPDPITFDKVEKINNSSARFYFTYGGGSWYYNANYAGVWTDFDNTVQVYNLVN